MFWCKFYISKGSFHVTEKNFLNSWFWQGFLHRQYITKKVNPIKSRDIWMTSNPNAELTFTLRKISSTKLNISWQFKWVFFTVCRKSWVHVFFNVQILDHQSETTVLGTGSLDSVGASSEVVVRCRVVGTLQLTSNTATWDVTYGRHA